MPVQVRVRDGGRECGRLGQAEPSLSLSPCKHHCCELERIPNQPRVRLLVFLAVDVCLGCRQCTALAWLLSHISHPGTVPSHLPALGLPLPFTKEQKEFSNNFKKHFCSARCLQRLPGCLHLPVLESPLQRKLFPAGAEWGTWAGGNAAAKRKTKRAGRASVCACVCVGMYGGALYSPPAAAFPIPYTRPHGGGTDFVPDIVCVLLNGK